MVKHKIALITDLDKNSKTVDEDGETVWKSLLMKGTLDYDPSSGSVTVELESKDKATSLYSEYARGGRGMELSELVSFCGELYTVDDRTGIVYNISDDKAIPWAILATGNGKKSKGFKGEWMSAKDGRLYVGGHGREFFTLDGKDVIHRDNQWIKILTKDGGVEHKDWASNYDKIRSAAGYSLPGFMTHEAVEWSEVHKRWFFLPRKASAEPYSPEGSEKKGTNLLIICSEDFSDIKVVEVGKLTSRTKGYSTFKFIPGTDDKVIVAIKSEEIGDTQKSYITAFTVDGKVLLEDQEFSIDMKYEGIVFL